MSNRVRRQVEKHLKEDYLRADSEQGIYAFYLPPFKEGQREVDKFISVLSQELGGKKTDTVMESMFNYHAYSAFGQHEMRVTFQNENGDVTWTCERLDSETNDRYQSQSIRFESFIMKFGPILDLSGTEQ